MTKTDAGADSHIPDLVDEPVNGSRPADMQGTGRRQITIRPGQLHLMATEAEDALITGNSPLYVRASIVRPVVDEMPASNGRTTRSSRLVSVDNDTLIDHLSRCSDWQKFNVRKAAYVAVDPPRSVAATILARDGEWRLHSLAGVITTPTLRPDGTVLSAPGYDSDTRLLLLRPPEMPSLPPDPTRADAMEALALLDTLLDDFPFCDPASRSVALSGLITPVVRGAMTTAPLHAFSAPVAGAGKSYLVDLASAISTGEPAPVIAAGRTEEETEKRLCAALLGGQAIISIDNVNGQLGGDLLCQLIERPVVSIRPLGVSRLIRIESRATTFATGNNIQLVGDMTRRTILCSLDPRVERPELRRFQFDPFARVVRNRGAYVAAALTIVRAYVAAGCPGELLPLASFETWSRLVRSALVWLGRADPVMTMEAARSEDPTLVTLTEVMREWLAAIGNRALTSGKAKDVAETRDPLGNLSFPDFSSALMEVASGRSGPIDAKRLGVYLSRVQNRVIDGHRFRGTEDPHTKQKLWRVERVGADPRCG
jgi:putative DNA primase/helicase